MRAIAIAILLFSVIGCIKDKEEPLVIIDPVYERITLKGTFQRNNTTPGPKVAVEFELTASGTYNNKGIGYANRYPVIGRGRVETGVNYITFTDSSFYTADFDWSIILNGKYEAYQEGDSVVFKKNYNNKQQDIYKLKLVHAN